MIPICVQRPYGPHLSSCTLVQALRLRALALCSLCKLRSLVRAEDVKQATRTPSQSALPPTLVIKPVSV
jgi:hypothetical protein